MVKLQLSWLILIIAGLFEALWVYYLKRSNGFSNLQASLLFVATLFISMLLLSYSMKSLPMSVAYPVWTGIGAVGSVIIGWWIFKETMSIPLIISLIFLLLGLIGLKVFS